MDCNDSGLSGSNARRLQIVARKREAFARADRFGGFFYSKRQGHTNRLAMARLLEISIINDCKRVSASIVWDDRCRLAVATDVFPVLDVGSK
jgi:hypothetical protein